MIARISGLSGLFCAALCLASPGHLRAQSVQPLIAEYTDHASGFFEVTNSSLEPSVVVLEPKSFSIDEDGTGEFRALDPSIHLELSMTSVRLEPHQTARVFYKVSADTVPAWLSIYAGFSPLKAHAGLNVRILLPHTIYLYQRQPLQKSAIEMEEVRYDAGTHIVTCALTNRSTMAGRAASVEVSGQHASASQGGFPMLPHERRVLSIEWTSPQAPRNIAIEFPRFSVTGPVKQPSE